MIKKLPDSNSNLEEYLPFRDISLIVSDIDGTLISGSDSVIKQIRKAIKKLEQQKVFLTIATGRTFYGSKFLLNKLEIKTGMPIAFYNGSIVLEAGTKKVLYSNFIPHLAIEKLLKVVPFDNTRVYLYVFEVISNALIENYDNLISEKVYGLGQRRKDDKDIEFDVNNLKIEWIDDVEFFDFSVNAILIETEQLNKHQLDNIEFYLKSQHVLDYTNSGSGFIEIKAKGSNKGIIYDVIKNKNELLTKKILSIGDNDNDYELFKFSDISVAVANSSISAIKTADYICKNESSNGFLDMLNVIITAKKYCKDGE